LLYENYPAEFADTGAFCQCVRCMFEIRVCLLSEHICSVFISWTS
jgi:hypothetical protein